MLIMRNAGINGREFSEIAFQYHSDVEFKYLSIITNMMDTRNSAFIHLNQEQIYKLREALNKLVLQPPTLSMIEGDSL